MRLGKIFIGCFVLCSIVVEARTQRIGTFNIRTDSSKDTADLAWDERQEFVARQITDNDFDVIGLCEVKDTQYKYLSGALTDYASLKWGRNGSSGEGVCIFYRKDRYRLLTKGHYYLSTNPASASLSWNSNYIRMSVYVGVEDVQSGEIFYFCATHLDNGTSLPARREESRLNVDQMREISEGYPFFIAGDMNTHAIEPEVFYPHLAYMESAAELAEKKEGPSGTWSGWASTGTSVLDYIFCHRARVKLYKVLNEMYGRPHFCSDHFPVLLDVELKENTSRKIYVSLSGGADADGSLLKPYATIQQAVAASQKLDTICLLDEKYVIDTTLVLPHTLYLYGREDGKTTLVGGDGNTGLIKVEAPAALHVANCTFYGGSAKSGGAVEALGYELVAKNCTFDSNTARLDGGAIYAEGRVTLDSCCFVGNSAKRNGGAVCVYSIGWKHKLTHCQFMNNVAQSAATMYVTSSWAGYMAYCSFTNNVSSEAAYTYTNPGQQATFTAFCNTFANNASGAVALNTTTNSMLSLVSNTIVGNTCDSAAVYVGKGQLQLYNSIVAGNEGGDLRTSSDATIYKSAYNVFTADEDGNNALIGLLGGEVQDGTYVAQVDTDGVVTPLSAFYAGEDVAVLPKSQYYEMGIYIDLDDNGKVEYTYCLTDQHGQLRNEEGHSMSGAVELPVISDVNNIKNINLLNEKYRKIIEDNRIVIVGNNNRYGVLGF